MANDVALSPDPKIEFTIGGNTILARPLTLWDLQVCKEDIDALQPGQGDAAFAWIVVRILAHLTSPEDSPPDMILAKAKEMAKRCSIKEMREIGVPFNKLLEVSGFERADPLPLEAASPGTGTSIESPLVSPPAASAGETSAE